MMIAIIGTFRILRRKQERAVPLFVSKALMARQRRRLRNLDSVFVIVDRCHRPPLFPS